MLRLTTIILLLISATVSFSQQNNNPSPGYYMIIAAYNQEAEGYAQRYIESLRGQGTNADYSYFSSKKMFLVYTKFYSEYGAAIADINSTREETSIDGAWVYIYKGDESSIDLVSASEESTEKPSEAQSPPEENEANENTDAQSSLGATEPEDGTVLDGDLEDVEPPREMKDDSKLVYFEALDARTQDPVDVEVSFKDPVSGNLIGGMKSNQTARIQPPSNPDNLMQVSVNSFGWVTDAVYYNFEDPINDSTSYFLKQKGDTLVILFDMHRMKKGDFQVLYNVYFIPDASLMRPISETQLTELYNMMAEDRDLRIKLHGHTNGNSRGEYYRLSEDDTIFFAMNKKHEKTNGSAKQLSYDRANTIKRYLVHHGIKDERIEVEGWGGKKMIYDKLSKANTRNIRVEVEILEE